MQDSKATANKDPNVLLLLNTTFQLTFLVEAVSMDKVCMLLCASKPVLVTSQLSLILHCKEKQKMECFSKLVFHCIHHRNRNETGMFILVFLCGLLLRREITAVGKTPGCKVVFPLKSLLN